MSEFPRFARALGAAIGLLLCGTSAAFGQVAAPPVLTADGSDHCGWALGSVGAALGGALLAPSQSKAHNWSGLYVGGHLGCAWGETQWTFANASLFSNAGGATDFDNTGWVGGGQVGYNVQLGHWVVGVEATLSNGDLRDQSVNVLNPLPAINSTRLTSDIDSLVTVVARLGYSWDRRWMGYVKGGYASGDVDVRLEIASAVASASASASSRHGGWTIGTGVEYFLTKNVVVGIDYSFINLEDKTYQLTCVAACGVNPVVNVDPESIHMLTGRISFKFSGPEPAPLK